MTLAPNPGANPDAQLPDDVRRLPQEARINLLGQKTNCYLIFTGSGTWVVDPPSDGATAVTEILEGVRGRVAGILLTHAHPDHIGGVAALSQRTGAIVHAHPAARAALEAELPFQPLQEGGHIEGWRVYELPGHRFDSLCFLAPATGCAIVGDMVAGAGTVIIDPSDGDLFDYLRSLHRLKDELRPTLLAPGHGPLIDQPATLLSHYIEHRLARERRVLAALAETPRPLAALLPLAYADTNPALYPLAERSLLSHLLKLQKEGRTVRSEQGWTLKGAR